MYARDVLTEGAGDAGTGRARNRPGGRRAIKEYLELDTGITCACWIGCVNQGDKRNTGVAIGHQQNVVPRIKGRLVGAKVSTVYSRPGAAALLESRFGLQPPSRSRGLTRSNRRHAG